MTIHLLIQHRTDDCTGDVVVAVCSSEEVLGRRLSEAADVYRRLHPNAPGELAAQQFTAYEYALDGEIEENLN